MRLRLLSEMPIQHHKIISPQLAKDKRAWGKSTYRAYSSPVLIKKVSEKLSRLVKHKINIFVVDLRDPVYMAIDRLQGGFMAGFAELAGVDPSELESAVNFLMVGDGGQVEFSTWLYVHQLGEALNSEYRGEAPDSGGEDSCFDGEFAELGEIAKAVGVRYKLYSGSNSTYVQLLYKVLKLGSVRANLFTDHAAEIITEYLWHGGRIRLNQLPDADVNEAVVKVFEKIKARIDMMLVKATGRFLFNVDE